MARWEKKIGPDGKYQSIRIFKSPILEACTHVHPIIPLLLWGPCALYWFYTGITRFELTLTTTVLLFVTGILFWTFFEYAMHRIIFHWDAKSDLGKRFVFLFHGLHHDDPDDPTRLVFPPVPAIAIVSLIYLGFQAVLPAWSFHVFLASFIVGYLCYDYIHYATHHFPMTSTVGRYLKKYHLQHHFQHAPAKYGVSNPLWDYVFKTVEAPKK